MSQDNLDRMVQENETFRVGDESSKHKIEAKNGLENSCEPAGKPARLDAPSLMNLGFVVESR